MLMISMWQCICLTDTVWKVSVFRVFQGRIFPHSDWIQRDTEYLFVFSPNTGKYGSEKFQIRTLFMQWEYSDIHSKTSGSIWQYYRDEPALNINNAIIDFPANNNNSSLFKFKEKITEQTGANGTKNFEIMIPLKYIITLENT